MMMKLDKRVFYAVYNIKVKNFLNYARKDKKLFSKNFSYYAVHSPYPSCRLAYGVLSMKQWIKNTAFPENYRIVKFRMVK